MYINSLKFLLLFNNKSIFEEISQTYFAIKGENTTVDILSSGAGYSMQNDQYIFGDSSGGAFVFNIENKFTMGFWIYSVNQGEVENPNTSALEPLELTVLDLRGSADISVDGGSVLNITEVSNDSGKNQIKLDFKNGTYTALSEKYDSDKWHYVWFVYSENSVELYVDGVSNDLDVSGSLSSSLDLSFVDIYVNHSVDGYAYNLAKHTGFIDDIFILDEVKQNEDDIQRAINYGILNVVDDSFSEIRIDGYGIHFDDPTTITVNTSIDDMSYVYLGRNDGKILRGSPKFWQVRKTYDNENENDLLELKGDDTVENGLLKIKDSIIRL